MTATDTTGVLFLLPRELSTIFLDLMQEHHWNAFQFLHSSLKPQKLPLVFSAGGAFLSSLRLTRVAIQHHRPSENTNEKPTYPTLRRNTKLTVDRKIAITFPLVAGNKNCPTLAIPQEGDAHWLVDPPPTSFRLGQRSTVHFEISTGVATGNTEKRNAFMCIHNAYEKFDSKARLVGGMWGDIECVSW